MIRSMTGYGQGSAEAPGLRVTVVLRGLNNRFADVRLKLPAELQPFEADLRRRCQKSVRRGRLEVAVSLERTDAAGTAARIDRQQVESILAAAAELAAEHGLEGRLDLASVLSLPGVLQSSAQEPSVGEAERAAVVEALDAALEAVDVERRREGETLRTDLLERFETMIAIVGELRSGAADVPEQVRDRLRQRVDALTQGVELDPARVAQEVAFLADRADITEELVRLDGHLTQMRSLLSSPDGEPVGKRLDFLVQEVHRETNTIGSKAAKIELSRLVLDLKTENERVREQVQNLE